MIINGWAYTSKEKETSEQYKARHAEIKDLWPHLNMKKSPQYGHTKFSGELTTPEAQELSELDLALIADHGNLCFGGECTKSGNKFWGSYNVD